MIVKRKCAKFIHRYKVSYLWYPFMLNTWVPSITFSNFEAGEKWIRFEVGKYIYHVYIWLSQSLDNKWLIFCWSLFSTWFDILSSFHLSMSVNLLVCLSMFLSVSVNLLVCVSMFLSVSGNLLVCLPMFISESVNPLVKVSFFHCHCNVKWFTVCNHPN